MFRFRAAFDATMLCNIDSSFFLLLSFVFIFFRFFAIVVGFSGPLVPERDKRQKENYGITGKEDNWTTHPKTRSKQQQQQRRRREFQNRNTKYKTIRKGASLTTCSELIH